MLFDMVKNGSGFPQPARLFKAFLFSFFLRLNSCWSSSLDNALKRHTERSTKHWFSLYQLVERYLEEQRMDTSTGTYCTSMKMLGHIHKVPNGSKRTKTGRDYLDLSNKRNTFFFVSVEKNVSMRFPLHALMNTGVLAS